MDRVETGVFGLDELLAGGLPRGRMILVSGACGTGKSIFSMQYIYKGALDYDEPGVFVTFDEMPEKIRQDMLQFGWNIKELEEQEKMAIIDATSARAGTPSEEENAILPGQFDLDRIIVEILSVARKINAKRIVIDSVPAMAFRLENANEIRRAVLKIAYMVARSGMTAIITSEVEEQSLSSGQAIKFSKYEVEEYVADGVIMLNFLGVGSQATRTMYIRKMRGTKHSLEIHPLEITDKGMEIRKIEEVFG